jgi:ribosomal-protein-alanine N-acetyltransferase
MMTQTIQAGHVTLRPFTAQDVDDVFDYAADPEWSRYLIALPSSSYQRADAERFVASQGLLDWGSHPSWAIELEGRAVGGLSVRFSAEHRIGELGYAIARRVWGQGLAVEAARAALDVAFTTYPQLVRIRATTDARNARSLRVMEKLGMKREGRLRSDRLFRGELVDEIVCGLLRDEWRRTPAPA